MQIIIKIGKTVINTTSKELAEVNETPDGVVFEIKGGMSILYTNLHMPSSAKQIIKNTADQMINNMEDDTKSKLIFEPGNAKAPARIEAP